MTSCGERISQTERAPLLTMIPLPPTARLSAAAHRNSHSAPVLGTANVAAKQPLRK